MDKAGPSSMMMFGGGDSQGIVGVTPPPPSPSPFLPQGRMSTVLLMNEEESSSVHYLHVAFAKTIVSMTSRLQLFEVMDDWMILIERALGVERYYHPEIPDQVYNKLVMLLKKEYETWDLVKTLYYERLNVREEEDAKGPLQHEISDRFRLDELSYATEILRRDKPLQEMDLIINWLELNYSRQGDPDLTQKHVAWEQTLYTLQRDARMGRWGGGCLVTNIDPDAPYREGKVVQALDEEEELRIMRGTFHYLRTGNIEKAVSFLHQSGHIAKAKALLGSLMSQKMPLEEESEEPMDNGSGGDFVQAVESRRKKFVVTGNPHRLMWKNAAWSICDQEITSKWERAAIGACCGHRPSMLEVAHTWEDRLWAYLKAAVNSRVERQLRSLNKRAKQMDLPSEFWSQGMDIADILEELEEPGDQEFNIKYMFDLLQKCVMKDDLNTFVQQVYDNMDSLFADADHPIIVDHLARFLTHILLSFAITELCYHEQLTNTACDAFINVLVKNGLFVAIPFYVQKLSFNLQTSVIVSQIQSEIRYTTEEILNFLGQAVEHDLDILTIAVAIVEKLKEEVELFDVEMLQWISCCFDLVQNQSDVLLEYLRYTVWISRKYLTMGDLDRVRKLAKEVTSECVQVCEKLAPKLVREFVCYQEYLEADTALTLWKQARSQRPTPEHFPEEYQLLNMSIADRTLYERKRKEFENMEHKWSKAVEFHGKVAIDAFMKILKFPDGGWLRNCCSSSDERESNHINAVRRVMIKKVVFLVLNLSKERSKGDAFRELAYVLCDKRRKIIDEFSPSEIGSIFKVMEEFTRIHSPDLTVLPNS